jgi:hypothetical protein
MVEAMLNVPPVPRPISKACNESAANPSFE